MQEIVTLMPYDRMSWWNGIPVVHKASALTIVPRSFQSLEPGSNPGLRVGTKSYGSSHSPTAIRLIVMTPVHLNLAESIHQSIQSTCVSTHPSIHLAIHQR